MKNKMLIILTTSALFFLIGIFSMNHYLFAFGITQFVVVVFSCTLFNLKGVSISDAVKYNDKQLDEALKKRNALQIFAYSASIPAVIIGILSIVLITISAWFIKF